MPSGSISQLHGPPRLLAASLTSSLPSRRLAVCSRILLSCKVLHDAADVQLGPGWNRVLDGRV